MQSWGDESCGDTELKLGNWHSCKVAELESCRDTEFRAIECQSVRVAEEHGDKATELRNGRIAE